ncbi:methyltransferase type 11 [Halobacteriales archaeon QS_1_68_20]|nr:MAG: methyltransferase type 11 [Halobacteriales archaeon QS_1_68_20]
MTTSDHHKAAARHAWSTGRYPSLAPNLLPAVARLVNAAGVEPEDAVLDVGCGTGNAALTARRTGADVVGVDLARRMLELAGENVAVAGATDVDLLEGDAEHLPFRDGAFDVTVSNFGHVFAPDAEAAGRELVRVVRSGGRVAFTAWSPDGLVGRLTEVLTDHVDAAVEDPWAHLRWGDPSAVRSWLPGTRDVRFSRRIAQFRYASPAHFWREFAEESGPLAPVVGRLEAVDARRALRDDAVATLEEWFADNAISVEYLQVRAVVD